MSRDWFIYRFWIEDRIYYVIRTTTGVHTGWLRTDGEEFGGHAEVFARWLHPVRAYRVNMVPFVYID